MSRYDLAYKSVDELPALAPSSVDPTTDYVPVYDASAARMKKMLANAPAYTSVVAAGSALTMSEASHAGKTINLDTAAGSTVTLPASTGSGAVYRFRVSVLATSNNHIIKVANSSDAMEGYVFSRDDTSDNAVAFFATAGTSDTITLNRSTTGSVVIGEYIEITDIAANRFHVRGMIANTGTPATPFSATV